MTVRFHEDFSGKVVIVTGAGSGIGRAAARGFARAGARVLAVGRREDALAETVTGHPGIVAYVADVCTPEGPGKVVEAAIGRWGRLDVLVNSAAAAKAPAETTVDDLTGLFDLNVTAPSMLAHAALPHLRRTKGSIVNVSSTYGHRPISGAACYAASKAALGKLTRSWALELAADGVRVNALAPGPAETTVEQVEQDQAASWIMRLAHPATTWLTGQVLTVGGSRELG